MCIGIPMQVVRVEPGHAQCSGRGQTRRVRTALVGDVARGDWLLVFIDSAQERMTVQRADEVNATLDLLQQALEGAAFAPTDPRPVAFELPSAMSPAQLQALSGPSASTLNESNP